MNIKERVTALDDLPHRHSTITIRDGREIYVENCRCVCGCDDNFITLSVYGMKIKVSGTPLILESFGSEGVKISGKIHSLTMEET